MPPAAPSCGRCSSALAAAALGGVLLAGRELVQQLTGDAPATRLADVLPATLMLAGSLAGTGITAVLLRRLRFIIGEHVTWHVSRQIVGVTTTVDYELFESQRFNDLLDRAAAQPAHERRGWRGWLVA